MGAAGAASGEITYVDDVFSTFLYDGNSGSQSINNGIDLAGEGGLVWLKCRTNTERHSLQDTERGVNLLLDSGDTIPQSSITSVNAFNSNGFSLNSSNGIFNETGKDYVSWTFRKAPGFFDVVTYTGNGSVQNISHSLGSVPGMIIVKNITSTTNWEVYHKFTDFGSPQNYKLELNEIPGRQSNSNVWNDTAPTSTQFTVGTNNSANGDNYVAYIFADAADSDAQIFGTDGDEGIIYCGMFSGSGVEVNLGWEPQWLMVKPYTQSWNWEVYDNMRGVTTNASGRALKPNNTDAEAGTSSITFTSTGFTQNTFGASYPCIYVAIRRPHKPPTAATEVFKPVVQTAQGTVTAGFPIDMAIFADNSSTWGYNSTIQNRLNGGTQALVTNTVDAELSSSNTTFDSNTSLTDGWISGGQSGLYLNFKRAPGFFDMVAYTGSGVPSTVVNHNLGAVPELTIIKRRDQASTYGWYVWANVISSALSNLNGSANLNTANQYYLGNTMWNTSPPTSTQFIVDGAVSDVGASSATYIAYLFATLPGISKVGSYTGTSGIINVDCGFTAGARFVMIKRTDGAAGGWYLWDSARGITSGNDPYILLNSTASTVTNTDYIAPYSAGFTVNASGPAELNDNGGTYLFLAIA